MDVDWHDAKSDRTLRERGFDFAYAARVFEGPTEEFRDNRKVYLDPIGKREERVIAFGTIGGRLYAVVYTQRGAVRWIISAIKCKDRELRGWRSRAGAGR